MRLCRESCRQQPPPRRAVPGSGRDGPLASRAPLVAGAAARSSAPLEGRGGPELCRYRHSEPLARRPQLAPVVAPRPGRARHSPARWSIASRAAPLVVGAAVAGVRANGSSSRGGGGRIEPFQSAASCVGGSCHWRSFGSRARPASVGSAARSWGAAACVPGAGDGLAAAKPPQAVACGRPCWGGAARRGVWRAPSPAAAEHGFQRRSRQVPGGGGGGRGGRLRNAIYAGCARYAQRPRRARLCQRPR